METSLTGRLRIESWEEAPTHEYDDGSKLARAEVRLAEGDGGLETATMSSVLYYRPDGTSRFSSMMRLEATLDGQPGSVVLLGTGSYDGTTADLQLSAVPGSGTGPFTGITTTCASSSTHADYPFMPLVVRLGLE